jgi:hypothetical protein
MRILKQPILILPFVILLPILSNGQSSKDTISQNKYLFDHFINGSVRLKTGVTEQASLNYNTDDQNIAFERSGQLLTLTNPDDIDTIYIENKKLIPAIGKFYEVLTTTKIALFATYTNKTRPIVAGTDHSGTSKHIANGVSNTVTDYYMERNFNSDYALEINRHFWLRRGNTFYKADSEKQIANVFPGKSAVIPTFIKENKINLKDPADMEKLIEFCNK